MHDQNSIQKSNQVRRVFRYGDHEFDDPGREYTVEQVRQALLPYFPELAHATTDEQTLEDGTRQITFRKQVTRKGNDIRELANRLEALSPYADPVTELQERLSLEGVGAPQTCTLQTLLDHSDEIENVAEQIRDRSLEQKLWCENTGNYHRWPWPRSPWGSEYRPTPLKPFTDNNPQLSQYR